MCISFIYFQIEVEARDNANPEKFDRTQVIVNVEIDEFNPAFVPPGTAIAFTTEETQPVNHTVGSVLAEDNDRRGTIVYETDGIYPGVNFFDVNPRTGEIYIKQDLMDDTVARTTYIVSI